MKVQKYTHIYDQLTFYRVLKPFECFPVISVVKNLPANARDSGLTPGSERSLGEKTAAHSSIFAWEIPWTEEPGGLQSIGLPKSRHDLATKQQNHSIKERIIFSTDGNGTTGHVHAAGPLLHPMYKN